MIDDNTIFQKFCLLAELDSAEAQKWQGICSDAGDQLTRRLKQNADLTGYTDALAYAAASIAFYQYLLIRSANDAGQSMAVGDIKVSKSSNQSAVALAKAIREEALGAVSQLLADDAFVFRRIGK